jgi:hypothetical protein
MHLLKRTAAKREGLVWRACSNPRLAVGSARFGHIYVTLKPFCRERRIYRIDEGFIAIDIFDFLFQMIYGHIDIPERKGFFASLVVHQKFAQWEDIQRIAKS